ncbi:lytic transglycosylase domain-containing protein [Megamonas funiformis]|jgi:soluble lytic murein transglycosylase|uniref:lytic transglycosylase domain-containing protein n=1 Tax=Megamonas funiformis TaxID=437897 RepID=UPI003B9683DD
MSSLMSEGIHHQVNIKTKRKMSFWKKLLLMILVLASLSYFIWQNEDFQRKYLYPYDYQDTINFYADRYEVDRNLVASVILAESKFRQDATSVHGARGLMQIMPETGSWIATQIEDDSFSVDKLYNVNMNIKYGTWYLSELQTEFEGNEVLALAAYNAGRGNVYEWMEKYHWNINFKDYTKIPFPETREYVKRVLENKKHYNKLYK